MNTCFAKYCHIYTETKNQAATLTSANSIIGDEFFPKITSDYKQIYIQNKFEQTIGFIKPQDSKEIILAINGGAIVKIYLCNVYYDQSKKINYYGEVLCVSYIPKDKAYFDVFCENLSSRIRCGNMPEISIDDYEYKKIIETKGKWQPKKLILKKNKTKGSSVIKSKMTFTEKLVEEGRSGNIGCYIGSIGFLVVVAAIIIFIAAKLIFFI